MLDYREGLQIVKQCHEQKQVYQKFYIGLISAIVVVTIFIQKITYTPKNNEIISLLLVDKITAIGFLIATVIGFIIIKNLTQIRINAVFYNNAITDIRRLYINILELKKYPDVKFAIPNDRKSADYITVLLCSLVNLIMLNAGILSLIGDNLGIVVLNMGIVSIVYVFFHYIGIEKTLSKGIDTNWKQNNIKSN